MHQFTKRIHMIGIGGAGMYPLAEVLHMSGHRITGSDMQRSFSTECLEKLTIKVQYSHEADLVKDAELVVYSSAVKENNPERQYAAAHNIPTIRRAELLGELMRAYYAVCVSGTHGKTTTTSLIGTVLHDALMDPTVLVGGMLRSKSSNAIIGQSNLMVAEADEYDRSFLAMYPAIAVITNIEADHLDCYTDLNDILETFVKFTKKVPFYGAVIACIDDSGVRAILDRVNAHVITYGINENAMYRAEDISYDFGKARFNVVRKNCVLGPVSLNIPGEHNIRNALAAIAVANEFGIPFDSIGKSLSAFGGVGRRFEIVGVSNGVTVVDDYAHHPGEIRATINAAMKSGYKRVVAVFQPHLYSRTRDFLDDFAKSLATADYVCVTKIYKSREEPIPGVSAEKIVELLGTFKTDNYVYIDDMNEIPGHLKKISKPGDVLLFMGAGDINKIAHRVIAEGLLQ